MANNTFKGRTFTISTSDDDGLTFTLLGGIKTKDFTRDNPVSDSTNQATGIDGGGETESAFNGYSTLTFSGNGTWDTRASATLLSSKQFSAIANSLDPRVYLKIEDADESYEGEFNITSFGKSSEENGLLEFSASFQNAGTIAFAQT